MTTTTKITGIDELKERQRGMWGLGDYARVADTVIPDLGRTLVDACGVTAADAVLDIAAGPGNAALPAARRGARVTAVDFSEPLLAELARRSASEDLGVECVLGDAEALDLADGGFDIVLSCVGVMFAPRHQSAADEIMRVCRHGGRIGILSWTPDGFVGRMLAAMRPFVPAPPAGTQPPPLWGDPDHVAGLFGDRVTDLDFTCSSVRVDCFRGPREFRAFFQANYGPTVAAYRGIAGDPERTAALDKALEDLAAAHQDSTGAMDWDFLIAQATTKA